jgi:hypothetical protein
VQAMATGDVSDLAALRSIVNRSFEVTTYEPTNETAWSQAYERFQAITRR